MPAGEPVTLKEVQKRLGVPQHILIHLCDKGVVEPDIADAHGRGNRRQFSERNIFEFAVALGLRRFEISVAKTAAVVRLLRSFERSLQRRLAGFDLVSLLADRRLELSLHLLDGESLVLAAAGEMLKRPIFMRALLGRGETSAAAPARIEQIGRMPEAFDARLDVNLARIATRVGR